MRVGLGLNPSFRLELVFRLDLGLGLGLFRLAKRNVRILILALWHFLICGIVNRRPFFAALSLICVNQVERQKSGQMSG